MRNFKRRRLAVIAGAALLTAGGGLSAIAGTASSASPPGPAIAIPHGPYAGAVSEKVSTTGTDSGNCVSSPCATINYAISQASPGETIKVAAGTYNQTVDVNKAVTILGAGASSTTLDGANLDPSNSGYFGVVHVGNAGGTVTVSGFTITNPAPYAYTGGEPMAVALADPNTGDIVNIINDTITEGSADSSAGTDFPIGIDSFVNKANTYIAGNTISGFFQGALLEDNGPVKVNNNKFTGLISNSDTSTNPATVYPAEGLFFLADLGTTLTGQNATGNSFNSYSGYGIAEDAGYGGGYVTPGCIANGSIQTALTNNVLALTAGPKADGIALQVTGTGNSLTGTLNNDRGYVTSPSDGIHTQSISPTPTSQGQDCTPYSPTNGGGGSLDITQNNGGIRQITAKNTSTASRTTGGLHVPHHPHHHA